MPIFLFIGTRLYNTCLTLLLGLVNYNRIKQADFLYNFALWINATYTSILLHMWGSLGSMTLALLQQWTGVSLVMQQYLQITMETDTTQQCKLRRYYGNGDVIELTSQSGLEIGRVRTRVFGCGLLWDQRAKFVSEIVRGAREFIRWAVKTFDRRGW
jgi:hypothetical protein